MAPRGHTAKDFRVGGHGRVQIGDRHYYTKSASKPSRYHNKYYEVPRGPSSVFTGRDKLLQQLRNSCLPVGKSSQGPQKRFVIWGLGGSGKTQLCLKFAEENREKFWGIFWIDASSEASIERSFAHIGKICGLDPELDSVKRWLSNRPDSWALIFDNADNPELDLSRFFPLGNRGSILITTRNPGCRVHAVVGTCELGRLELNEAVTLLKRVSDFEDQRNKAARGAAKQVVLTLGCLALAIAQAGAVIRMRRCSFEDYSQIYSRRRKDYLQEKILQGNDSYEHTVWTTWEVSLSMIEEMSTEAGQDAIEILQILSFFHFDGIPEEIFYQAWKGLKSGYCPEWLSTYQPKIMRPDSDSASDINPDSASALGSNFESDSDPDLDSDSACYFTHIRAALAILSSYSLIRWGKDSLISLHPLVHAWARDRMSGVEQERVWTHAISTLAFSARQYNETKDYRYRISLVPHVDACLSLQKGDIFHLLGPSPQFVRIMQMFVRVYWDVHRFHEALELTEKVVEALMELVGKDHPETLYTRHTVSRLCYCIGRTEEALEIAEEVVKSAKSLFGEEDTDTLIYIDSLAHTYLKIRLEEGLELSEKVVEIRIRKLGEKDLQTLESMNILSDAYDRMGLHQKALELQEKVVKIAKRQQGDEHPVTLEWSHNLAYVYFKVHREQEALKLLEHVVEARIRVLGEEHPHTIRSKEFLAKLRSSSRNKKHASGSRTTPTTKRSAVRLKEADGKSHLGFRRLWKKLIQ